ncbi:MAG: dethiobiotin synthase [Polyangiaceae bacterium]|jgi:dethiobiotin synthetase
MTARLVVVTGTGTGIGKTHISEALLRALAPRHGRVVGIKPIESGVAEATVSDASRLDRASSFHVQLAGYFFADALSPHLAARDAGQIIDLRDVVDSVDSVRAQADLVLVELAGGLFTPLSDVAVNAHLVQALTPDTLILAAPDRLGVLHDVLVCMRAVTTLPITIDAVLLIAPEVPDASSGRNGHELARFGVPVLGPVPRATIYDLAVHPTLSALALDVSR